MKITKKVQWMGMFLLLAIISLPVISLAGGTKEIFVKASASGSEDGSYNHPYNTIGEAIKKANGKTKIIVRSGNYKENIVVPRDVKISGSDKHKVTIEGKSNSEPTITLTNKTELSDVSVVGGKNGILVKDAGKKGETTISNCFVRDARSDGIKIANGNKSSDTKVNIIKSKIYDNGKSGIYSERRRIVILESEILDNDLDGIDLEKSVEAYVAKNEINQNNGVGMKVRLDNASTTITKNVFYKNDKDGLEVRSGGKIGGLNVNRNSFLKNDNFGVVKILKDVDGFTDFRGLSVDASNTFSENKKGNISNIRIN